jgi:hypothetical protein
LFTGIVEKERDMGMLDRIKGRDTRSEEYYYGEYMLPDAILEDRQRRVQSEGEGIRARTQRGNAG